MPTLIAGIVAVVVLYALLNMFRAADPKWLARISKTIGGVVCLAVAAFTGIRGELAVAIPLGFFGLGLLGWSPLFAGYFNGSAAGGSENRQSDAAGRQAGPPASGKMTAEEAYQILGLKAGASREEIIGAHRALIKKLHPDQGGSTYLAARVNDAKDFLLRTHNH